MTFYSNKRIVTLFTWLCD